MNRQGDPLFQNERGTITIYLVIVFLIMIIFIGLFVDLARITVAQNKLRRATNTAARSVLADYDTLCKREFGIFTYSKTRENCSSDFAKYLKANLAPSAGQNFNLLDLRHEKSNTSLVDTLAEREVLKRQILEDMKYRAPAEIAVFVAEKISSVRRMLNFFEGKNVQRKRLDFIRKKSQEIKGISRGIDKKRQRLIDKEKVLEEKRDALAREKDPGAKSTLRREISELKAEIKEIKGKLRRDLERCRKLTEEINSEGISLIDNDYTGDKGTDEVGRHLREADSEISARLYETKDRIVEACAELKSDIEKCLKALNRGDYAQISLAVFNAYAVEEWSGNEHKIEGMLKSQEGNLREQVEKSVYADSFVFDNKEVSRDPNSFQDVNGQDLDQIVKNMKNILSIEDMLLDARDELYINEYILAHFSCLTEPSFKKNFLYEFYNSEAEYICFGESPKIKAIREIYLIRFGLDTMAYVCFSKAPADPFARFIYATVMGAIQASIDTCKLVLGKPVAIAEMVDSVNPVEGNPLKDIETNYKEHLRLLLFLHSGADNEAGKLKRILQVIQARNGTDPAKLNTVVRGSAEISIRMWFLPLAGLDNMNPGPFGTTIRNGRCYIAKNVEYGY